MCFVSVQYLFRSERYTAAVTSNGFISDGVVFQISAGLSLVVVL